MTALFDCNHNTPPPQIVFRRRFVLSVEFGKRKPLENTGISRGLTVKKDMPKIFRVFRRFWYIFLGFVLI